MIRQYLPLVFLICSTISAADGGAESSVMKQAKPRYSITEGLGTPEILQTAWIECIEKKDPATRHLPDKAIYVNPQHRYLGLTQQVAWQRMSSYFAEKFFESINWIERDVSKRFLGTEAHHSRIITTPLKDDVMLPGSSHSISMFQLLYNTFFANCPPVYTGIANQSTTYPGALLATNYKDPDLIARCEELLGSYIRLACRSDDDATLMVDFTQRLFTSGDQSPTSRAARHLFFRAYCLQAQKHGALWQLDAMRLPNSHQTLAEWIYDYASEDPNSKQLAFLVLNEGSSRLISDKLFKDCKYPRVLWDTYIKLEHSITLQQLLICCAHSKTRHPELKHLVQVRDAYFHPLRLPNLNSVLYCILVESLNNKDSTLKQAIVEAPMLALMHQICNHGKQLNEGVLLHYAYANAERNNNAHYFYAQYVLSGSSLDFDVKLQDGTTATIKTILQNIDSTLAREICSELKIPHHSEVSSNAPAPVEQRMVDGNDGDEASVLVLSEQEVFPHTAANTQNSTPHVVSDSTSDEQENSLAQQKQLVLSCLLATDRHAELAGTMESSQPIEVSRLIADALQDPQSQLLDTLTTSTHVNDVQEVCKLSTGKLLVQAYQELVQLYNTKRLTPTDIHRLIALAYSAKCDLNVYIEPDSETTVLDFLEDQEEPIARAIVKTYTPELSDEASFVEDSFQPQEGSGLHTSKDMTTSSLVEPEENTSKPHDSIQLASTTPPVDASKQTPTPATAAQVSSSNSSHKSDCNVNALNSDSFVSEPSPTTSQQTASIQSAPVKPSAAASSTQAPTSSTADQASSSNLLHNSDRGDGESDDDQSVDLSASDSSGSFVSEQSPDTTPRRARTTTPATPAADAGAQEHASPSIHAADNHPPNMITKKKNQQRTLPSSRKLLIAALALGTTCAGTYAYMHWPAAHEDISLNAPMVY